MEGHHRLIPRLWPVQDRARLPPRHSSVVVRDEAVPTSWVSATHVGCSNVILAMRRPTAWSGAGTALVSVAAITTATTPMAWLDIIRPPCRLPTIREPTDAAR